ncbi:AAA family ATPase [Nonomuraea sp. NPDC048882]|uniref:AAA family ATPase n=1 Tax=Nonomuraea sp. NPDC048882 TaxID=3154347 RepID=UPI0033C18DE2
MGPKDVTSRDAVLEAIKEYDRLGREKFLTKYDFDRSRKFVVAYDGHEYDSKPLLAAAHGYQYTELGPLPNKFSGGEQTTSRLRALGFEIRSPKKTAIDVRFDHSDCSLFVRYQDANKWTSEYPPSPDREHYKDIWNRLKELASWLSENTEIDVPLKPFTSQYQANATIQKDIWCCIFPIAASNKSYGLQVALIISGAGAEICICMGAGRSQLTDPEAQNEAEQALTDLRNQLASVPLAVVTALGRALPAGAYFRDSWRKPPGGSEFGTLDDWLAYASRPDGVQASISYYLTPEELQKVGNGLGAYILTVANASAPLFEYCYLGEVPVTQPARPFDVPTLKELAAAPPVKLQIDPNVYRSVMAAIRSGKHIILTGPPGTAKTTLAERICQLATEAGLCTGYTLTTATSDWTTYETIGGLRPGGTNGALVFQDGLFLKAIRESRWLLIDELNRSNFDKAFGQLFTVLSKQTVTLPYEDKDGRPVVLLPAGGRGQFNPAGYDIVSIPESWRIIATMNVFDKSLLYQMSFALMRRFAFIEVPSPPREVFQELWKAELQNTEEHNAEIIEDVLSGLHRVVSLKDIGPATFLDMARFAHEYADASADQATFREDLTFQLFYTFLLAQFEGVDLQQGNKLFGMVSALVGERHRERLRRTMADVLGLELRHDLASAQADFDDESLTGI